MTENLQKRFLVMGKDFFDLVDQLVALKCPPKSRKGKIFSGENSESCDVNVALM
jgi:hypothetical protein